jgi:hypothetical protein
MDESDSDSDSDSVSDDDDGDSEEEDVEEGTPVQSHTTGDVREKSGAHRQEQPPTAGVRQTQTGDRDRHRT